MIRLSGLIVTIWLTGWAIIPRGMCFVSLSALRWQAYDVMTFVCVAFLAVCVLNRPRLLTRFEIANLYYIASVGAVNALREIVTQGGARGAWEIVLFTPLGLALLLLIVAHVVRKKREDFTDII